MVPSDDPAGRLSGGGPPRSEPAMFDSAKLLWKRMLRTPGSIGTVAPSSPWMARELIQVALLDDAGVVVEIGAGTGPLTSWILNAAPHVRFVAVEPDEELRTSLVSAYPGVDVSHRTARELPEVLAERGLNGTDRVVSSVPWSLLPAEAIERELDGIVRALTPNGRFVTLVYAHSQALPSTRRLEAFLSERFHSITHSNVVWRNVPPGRWLVADRPR